MALPSILSTLIVTNRHAAMATNHAAMQAPHGSSDRYMQGKRGDATSKAQFNALGLFGAYDWWVDEYEGPDGRGWLLCVSYDVDAADTDSGSDETWVWVHHAGPEPRSTGWREDPGAAV